MNLMEFLIHTAWLNLPSPLSILVTQHLNSDEEEAALLASSAMERNFFLPSANDVTEMYAAEQARQGLSPPPTDDECDDTGDEDSENAVAGPRDRRESVWQRQTAITDLFQPSIIRPALEDEKEVEDEKEEEPGDVSVLSEWRALRQKLGKEDTWETRKRDLFPLMVSAGRQRPVVGPPASTIRAGAVLQLKAAKNWARRGKGLRTRPLHLLLRRGCLTAMSVVEGSRNGSGGDDAGSSAPPPTRVVVRHISTNTRVRPVVDMWVPRYVICVE